MFNPLSTNERNYLTSLLTSSSTEGPNILREDNRSQFDYRPITITQLTSSNNSQIEVKIGDTRVISQIYAKLVPPYKERPNEGQAVFSIDTSHLKSNAEYTQSNEDLNEFRTHLSNLLEKSLRETNALDTNSLCIVPGRMVWKIVIDINIINNDGNVYDACILSAVASWLSYRIPFMRKKGNKVISDGLRIYLTMLHIPLCVTFGLVDKGPGQGQGQGHAQGQEEEKELLYVCDASLKEEKVMSGMMNVAANIFDSICYLQFTSEVQVSCEEINGMLNCAKGKIKELHKVLKEFIDGVKVKDKKRDRDIKEKKKGNSDNVEMKDCTNDKLMENKDKDKKNPFDDCQFLSKVNSANVPQRKHFDILTYNIE